MQADFSTHLKAAADATQACLAKAMRPFGDLPIAQGMRHAVTGGKGMRGFLVIESARLMGAPEQEAVYAGAAVEALHAYSLVHDDLPCMDDDDLRRGQPTVHKKWDEATAVLVGDALQTLAFELLARPGSSLGAQRQLDLITQLAKASGAEGMVLGQAQDMAAETAAVPLTLNDIAHLQNKIYTISILEVALDHSQLQDHGVSFPNFYQMTCQKVRSLTSLQVV